MQKAIATLCFQNRGYGLNYTRHDVLGMTFTDIVWSLEWRADRFREIARDLRKKPKSR